MHKVTRSALVVLIALAVCSGPRIVSSADRSATHRYASTAASGATYYVATDGDDGDNGTINDPWATITHALDSVDSGDLILVRPGLYEGRIRVRGRFTETVTVRSEVPYQARLRHTGTVLTVYEAQGISIEGFDIAHSGPGAEPLLIQIQDLIDEPGGADFTSRITLRNNIIHDSYNNDLLKINNGAQQITVEGNLFYNQGDSDEHIDINSVRDVVVQDNVFFNDFEGSGRTITYNSSSMIVVKDSNGDSDGILGSEGITIRRNVFLHYEGSSGTNFVLLGEDGNAYFEARDVLVENNLFLGDSAVPVRAAFGCKGVTDVVVRHNTISGDLPGLAYAFRLNVEGDNLANDQILFANNIWSDSTGTMTRFSTTPAGESSNVTLLNNLYWNGVSALPYRADDSVNIADDPQAMHVDPLLGNPVAVNLPRWDAATSQFADGSMTIDAAFLSLVTLYGQPSAISPVVDAADAGYTSADDILGRARLAGSTDVGAYELPGDVTARVMLPVVVRGRVP